MATRSPPIGGGTRMCDGKQAELTAAQKSPAAGGRPGPLLADVNAIEKAAATWRATVSRTVDRERDPRCTQSHPRHRRARQDRVRRCTPLRFSIPRTRKMQVARAAGIDQLDHIRRWRDTVLGGDDTHSSSPRSCWASWCDARSARPLAAVPPQPVAYHRGQFADDTITPRGGGALSQWTSKRHPAADRRRLGSSQSARERTGPAGRGVGRAGGGTAQISNAELEDRFRLCGLAQPAGAVAQGQKRRLLPTAARSATPINSTTRAAHAVRGLHRRRCQTHAGADQRPSHFLAGRSGQRRARPGRPGVHPGAPPWQLSTRGRRIRGPRSVRPAELPRGGRVPLVAMLWQDLLGQRGEVPPRTMSRLVSSSTANWAAADRFGEWLLGACRTTGFGYKGARSSWTRSS